MSLQVACRDRAEREAALAAASWNVVALPRETIEIDLETDGGASVPSAAQVEAIVDPTQHGDPHVAMERAFRDAFGFEGVVACAHGKAAEAIWCQAALRPGDVVLANTVFPTTLFHHGQNQTRVFACTVREALDPPGTEPFKANLDLDRVAELTSQYRGRIPYLWVEVCCNALGGHPVSLDHMRQVAEFARRRGIRVVVNGTRILENAHLVQQREPGARDLTIREIVREFAALADGWVMSAAKDLLVDQGGLVAARDEEILRQLAGLCFMKGVAASARQCAAMRVGLEEALAHPAWMRERVGQVEALHSHLDRAGLPVLKPCGGHAVYLDAVRFAPHVPLYQNPAETAAAAVYLNGSVRIRPGFLGSAQHAAGIRLLRAAVPPRRYTRDELARAANVLVAAYRDGEQIRGLVPTRTLVGMPALGGSASQFRPAGRDEWTGTSWTQIWFDRARLLARHPLLVAEQQDGRYETHTWGEVARIAREAAAGLRALGVARGDRVAFLCENRLEWIAMDAACLALGAVSMPIATGTHVGRVAQILRVARPAILFTSSAAQAEEVLGLGDTPSTLRHVVVAGPAGRVCNPPTVAWDQLLETGAASPFSDEAWEAQIRSVPVDADATIMFTSGTSSVPAGVRLTQGNLVAAQLGSAWPFFENKASYYPLLLDLNHVIGRSSFYTAVFKGYLTVVLPRRIDLELDPSLFELFPPSILVLVPRVMEKLSKELLRDDHVAVANASIETIERAGVPANQQLDYADARRKLALRVRAKLGGRVQVIVHAGAILAPDVRRFFERAGVGLAEGYGMTECWVIAMDAAYDVRKPGTVGRPYPYTEVALSPGGEILVRGPTVCRGYLNERERDACAFDAAGWFHTGDRGELGADGYLRIRGLIKDTFNLADGSNVNPAWIETLLASDPLIAQAVLVGHGRPHLSALIVPDLRSVAARLGRDDAGIDDRDTHRLIRSALDAINSVHLAPAEQIRTFALLPSPFPASCVGESAARVKLKVDRERIADQFREEIAALYA